MESAWHEMNKQLLELKDIAGDIGVFIDQLNKALESNDPDEIRDIISDVATELAEIKARIF